MEYFSVEKLTAPGVTVSTDIPDCCPPSKSSYRDTACKEAASSFCPKTEPDHPGVV